MANVSDAQISVITQLLEQGYLCSEIRAQIGLNIYQWQQITPRLPSELVDSEHSRKKELNRIEKALWQALDQYNDDKSLSETERVRLSNRIDVLQQRYASFIVYPAKA